MRIEPAPVLFLLLAGTVIAESLSFDLPGSGTNSLAYPLSLASVILLGPTAGGMVVVLSAVSIADIRQRKPISVVAFNIGQLLVSTVVSGWAYLAVGGRILISGGSLEPYVGSPLQAAEFPDILVPMLAFALLSFVMNALLVSTGGYLLSGQPLREIWSVNIAWLAPMQMALAVLGFSIAQVLSISMFGFLLFVFPLVVSRQMYQRYMGLREAYGDTVRSLVGIVEAKDPYTRGHSERVAEYSVLLGEELGLSGERLNHLEYAALLHDLGKVGIRKSTLVKSGRLTDEEYEEIRQHPRIGAEIVSGVDYLAPIAADVKHHHERVDGSGYADGLSSSDIPFGSRILAVADSFDAMTTARPYRDALTHEEATEELRRHRGTQFDSAVVDSFLALVASNRVQARVVATLDGEVG